MGRLGARVILGAVVVALATPGVASGQTKAAEPQAAPVKTPRKTLGVLLFPGFELLDAYGPMELWGNLRLAPAALWGDPGRRVELDVVTVAPRRGEVASSQGPRAVADFGFDDAPRLDYLLVPGGRGVLALLEDEATLRWIRARARSAQVVMSVCNGASLLAAAGILDGRPATTNKMFWKVATAPGPRVKWVKRARWVDDGDVVTSSGVSAGMDMSLAVIGRLWGSELADWLGRVAEYDAHRDPTWDPFAAKAGLAD